MYKSQTMCTVLSTAQPSPAVKKSKDYTRFLRAIQIEFDLGKLMPLLEMVHASCDKGSPSQVSVDKKHLSLLRSGAADTTSVENAAGLLPVQAFITCMLL